MDQLRAATLKLTGWYLAVLILVCLAFSVTVYQISAVEFDRPLPPENQTRLQFLDSTSTYREIRETRASQGKHNLLVNLVMMNLVTLALGACASYLFARRTLQPIEQAMEAQTRFTSDASHELRTPLAVMRTENEIALRDKAPSVDSLKTIVSSNLEEVERLQQLTDRLLALSSEQQIVLEPFALNDAVSEAIHRHQLIADQKKITIKAKLPKSLPRVNANIDSVCDIISILVENAIKYSPAKTTISITAAAQGNTVTLGVADQGLGIPAGDIDHIFDRFYRADQSRSKQHVEGHGLGLALAQRLTAQNGGTITVANRRPKGTVFSLRLPKVK